jgi:hypothetical protein
VMRAERLRRAPIACPAFNALPGHTLARLARRSSPFACEGRALCVAQRGVIWVAGRAQFELLPVPAPRLSALALARSDRRLPPLGSQLSLAWRAHSVVMTGHVVARVGQIQPETGRRARHPLIAAAPQIEPGPVPSRHGMGRCPGDGRRADLARRFAGRTGVPCRRWHPVVRVSSGREAILIGSGDRSTQVPTR